MESASDRLKKVLNYLKISANKLALEKLKYNDNVKLYHIRSGRNNFSPEIAKDISEAFPEIDYNWLLTGEGEMLVNKNKPEKSSISYEPSLGRPFFDVDFTLGFEGLDNDISLNPQFNIDFPPANKKNVNWFRGKGNSMLGEIDSGDYIALEEIEDFSWFPLGRIYGVVTKNGFRTIKRIVKADNNDEYLLVSSNPDKMNFPDQSLPKKMIHKLYKVVFVIKDLDE